MTEDRSYVLTFASAGVSLTKIVTVVDGVVCSTREPNWPSRFRFSCYRVTSPDDLYGVLSQAAALDPAPCVLRAEPRAETGRRAIYDSDKGPAGMFTVPRAWVGFDFEKVPNPKREIAFEGRVSWSNLYNPLVDGDCIASYLCRFLPPQFHTAQCVWQITASAGKRRDELRARLWFLLDIPLDGRQVAAWCKPAIDQGYLDPCTLTNPVIPHFIAVKIDGDAEDPARERWGIIKEEDDPETWEVTPFTPFVAVPDYVKRLPTREQRTCRGSGGARRGSPTGVRGSDIPANSVATLRRIYGPQLNRRRLEAVAKIRELVEATATAGAGARHPTYLHAATAIMGICRYWAIPIDQPRQLLVEAYRSTLAPEEARTREHGSIEGVWDWIEAGERSRHDEGAHPAAETLAKLYRGGGLGRAP